MQLHPQVMRPYEGLRKDNQAIFDLGLAELGEDKRDLFIALPFREYEALMEQMTDYEDLMDLREAKENAKGQKGIPLGQAISELGIQEMM